MSAFTDVSREDSVTPPEYKPKTSTPKMFKIQSLLNPTSSYDSVLQCNRDADCSLSAHTSGGYPSSSCTTPRLATPSTKGSSKRTKTAKESPAFTNRSPIGQVNYSPYKLTERPTCLSADDLKELTRQHKVFKIKSAGGDGDGSIGTHTRYIPYSSDKKGFYGKTGRDGFNVFAYTFRKPNDSNEKEWTVMWDYKNGLTRTTPFFKACEHSKTIPQKALSTNPGLKDLAISTTGGAIDAQGYWLPYECARALCLTFCYHIRWALTPIFGLSFVRECLKPEDPGFARYKIDSETVRCARLEAEGWRQLPTNQATVKQMPRSVPEEGITIAGKELRPRVARPTFKAGSPFESDGDDSSCSLGATTVVSSPGISPKTLTHEAFRHHGWTSINSRSATPSTPHNTPVASLDNALLTQPHYYPWRPLVPCQTEEDVSRVVRMPTGAHDKHRVPKRRRSSVKMVSPDAEYRDRHSGSDAGESSSESDETDIVLSPPVTKKRASRSTTKRLKTGKSTVTCPDSAANGQKCTKSKTFTVSDYRAAMALLELSNC